MPVVGIVKKYLDAHLKRNTGAGFIFHGGDDQKPIAIERLIYEVAIPACEKAGIEWHGVHAFRRWLATILHDLEIDETNHQRYLAPFEEIIQERHRQTLHQALAEKNA